ncbi:hypothetical protein ABFX02_02G118900 [Erythranthe guttata]
MHAIKLYCMSMAGISISPICHIKHSPILPSSRISTAVCCENRDNDRLKEKTKKEIKTVKKYLDGVMEKFGEGVKENLSPKQKGDWKDITLMSLSFAVYIYMSQKIVCAYCAWMSDFTHPW